MLDSSVLSACTEDVRRFDRDRFLGALLARGEQREAILVLYAFNLEIARLREQIFEPTMGMIRLQWWRECLEEMATHSPSSPSPSFQHPLAQALVSVMARLPFDLAHLHALLDAREADWDERPFATLAAFLEYAEATSGRLNQAVLDVLGVTEQTAHVAVRDLGTAWAIMGLVRAVPFHAGIGRVALPEDMMAEFGVSEGDIRSGKPSDELNRLAFALMEHANYRLSQVRLLKRGMPKVALPALFQAGQVEKHITILRRAKGNPFDPRLAVAGPALFRFLRANFFGFW